MTTPRTPDEHQAYMEGDGCSTFDPEKGKPLPLANHLIPTDEQVVENTEEV